MSEHEPDLVVAFILDESGSMASESADTIKGVNDYISKIKKDHDGEKVLFSLTQFNSQVKVVHNAELIENIPPLTKETYSPNNLTALYDAIGMTIDEMSKRISQNSNVIITILTDGHENASAKYNQSKVKELIEEKKQKEWAFVFMGADPTAEEVGTMLGAQASIQYSKGQISGTMQGISEGTRAYGETRGLSANARSAAYVDAFRTCGKNFDMDITPEIDDPAVIESVYEDEKDEE